MTTTPQDLWAAAAGPTCPGCRRETLRLLLDARGRRVCPKCASNDQAVVVITQEAVQVKRHIARGNRIANVNRYLDLQRQLKERAAPPS